MFKDTAFKTYRLLRNGDSESAKQLIEKFLNDNPITFHKNTKYYYFDSFTDEVIFNSILNKDKTKITILKDDYPIVFNNYGRILMENDEYFKAKTYLKLANDLNPLNIQYKYNLIKVYDYETNYEMIEKTLKDALLTVHDINDLFGIYESLGYYYKQIKKCEISEILFNLNCKSISKIDKTLLKEKFKEMIYL